MPQFAEVTEPIRKLLSKDSVRWTPQATQAVRQAAQIALAKVPWLAFDPEQETRVETRLNPDALSIIML